MDVNRDGVVTLDEFLDCCRKDEAISQSMAVFDTAIWPCASLAGDRNRSSASNNKRKNTKLKTSSPADGRIANLNQNHHITFNNNNNIQHNYHSDEQRSRNHLHPNSVNIVAQYSNHDYHHNHHHTRHSDASTYSGDDGDGASGSGGAGARSAGTGEDENEPGAGTIAHRHNDGSPSLVKVKTWYTVAKQGVSC